MEFLYIPRAIVESILKKKSKKAEQNFKGFFLHWWDFRPGSSIRNNRKISKHIFEKLLKRRPELQEESHKTQSNSNGIKKNPIRVSVGIFEAFSKDSLRKKNLGYRRKAQLKNFQEEYINIKAEKLPNKFSDYWKILKEIPKLFPNNFPMILQKHFQKISLINGRSNDKKWWNYL